jgi:ABC-type phosphate transport system substrate-binding protein
MLVLIPALPQNEPGRTVAIVVHPGSRLRNVSQTELERIFRLRQQRWEDGDRIYLVMQEEGSFPKKLVLDKIYRMSSDELKRYWLTMIYRGEMTSFPKTFSSDESVVSFVSRVPNAIGFVETSRATEAVKVLRIEGKLPGDDGYLLTAGA